MFFIGIFGIDKKNEKIKNLSDTECRECSGHRCTLYKEYFRFHFFFITVFTWGKKYYLVCENCSSVYNVKEKKDSYTYWDLNDLRFSGIDRSPLSGCADSFDSRSDFHESVCTNCGAEIKESWTYCPACGKKLKSPL